MKTINDNEIIETSRGRKRIGALFDENAMLHAANVELLAALEDAEFLMRKAGQIAGPMQGSFNRSASDASTAIAKARGAA